MTTFAVFLRGINVGGVRIAMKDLRQVLTEAGYGNVTTLLASGNVVLSAQSSDPARVKSHIETILREAFGYEAWVIVKTPAEIAEIAAGYPFVPPDDGVPRHAYAVLTTGAATAREAAAECPAPSPGERYAARGDVLYWEVPKGSSLDTNVAKQLARARYKPLATTRNLNTLHKVLAACDALPER
ncbi:DUF1697 domain-containing protein [Arthrobacter halodurans]|uniref:DUF1697 domain-containing protein n=1 Tax=Arthrobacter halodurans TaxID=516699 RepID=A0ABV4UNM2_9MICC